MPIRDALVSIVRPALPWAVGLCVLLFSSVSMASPTGAAASEVVSASSSADEISTEQAAETAVASFVSDPANASRSQDFEISLLQPILALAAVLAAMFLLVWLLKKGKMIQTMQRDLLKQVAALSLGGKESIAVIECRDVWLVVGVTPHQITLLHTMPRGALSEPLSADAPSFKSWFDATKARFRAQQSPVSSDSE